jgi:hypothetical protein
MIFFLAFPGRYDSKQMALGEPNHALWNPSIFDGINQKNDKKEDIYVLLFDESLIQQLKKKPAGRCCHRLLQ